jgi:diguanylate cyclase (GGDEF)-like protein/PAS domain S-box-containing protein
MSRFFSSLRFRLILLVFLASLPAFGLILYSGLEQRHAAVLDAQGDALRLVRHVAMDQERMIHGAEELLGVLAQLPAVRDLPNPAAVSELLARVLRENPLYANIAVLKADGSVAASALPLKEAVSYTDRPWFHRAKQTRQFTIGEYQIGRISGKAEVPLVYPVADATGKNAGVMLYAALDLSWLSSLAAAIKLPAGATLAIVDQRGTFLVRHPNPEKFIGKTMPDMNQVEKILAAGEGTLRALGIDGNFRLYGIAALKGMPAGLFMRVGLLETDILAQAHKVLVRNLVSLTAVLLLALLAAWWLGNLLIMRGVNVLLATAAKVAAGDLEARSGLGAGSGEIHRLARTFDGMVEALQQREAELEKTNQFLENIFDESADSIGIVDETGKFIRWNKAGLADYGYTLAEIRGRSAFDMYPDKDALKEMLTKLRRDGFVRNYEINMQRKDGTVAPFALSIRLLVDANGKNFGSVCVARDLSEIKKTLTEFQNMNLQLKGEISERQQVEVALQDTLGKLKATVSEVNERNQQITLLNELGDLLQACLTREEAYNGITQYAIRLFPGLAGMLCLLNPRKSMILEPVAVWGDGLNSEQVFTADECWGIRKGAVHVMKGTSGLQCKHVPPTSQHDYLCVPMMAQGESLGLLFLQATGSPSESLPVPVDYLPEPVQILAVTVAKQVAMALANLNLRESLHKQAIVDPLTGLFNRRYMEESFEREIFRAKRREAPIGVIMVDLDHFKRINDNFGHEAGDLMLVSLAGLLKKNIRREDIPCRFGGEEFLLIMPETSLDITRQRAEMLRELISAMEVKHLGLSLGKVTASFGVACYPNNGASVEEVVRAADAALYRAKEGGRNRVELANGKTSSTTNPQPSEQPLHG